MSISNLARVNAKNCALIIIDMQNDFIQEGAPIECPNGKKLIPVIQDLKKWAHSLKIPVFYTQEEHRFQKIDFGLELIRSEPEHCVEGTKGVEIVEELKPKDDEYVIKKRRYSGYYLTDLEILMRAFDRDCLIITGVATNVCVYGTAFDSIQRDIQPIVVEDAVAGTSIQLHEAFLQNIDYVIGDVVTSNQLKENIK
ncbi:isochorismatase family protein [Microaceticoccus formicicus]|uniref:isochorismatase family protein n=1 Tax=Microaceticoccus formicicus TaxID=3118105 RepID=UPI003CD02787|nr:isochorismatase family cysteine hydrolase [Peptoniphilaceae bacterium AMB_02]